jgi:hypothetical protein
LLAPFTLVFPKNYDALKVVSLALWLPSIFLVYKLFSKRLTSPYLEILTALVALNPLLVGASVTVMSESAYLFFSLLALLTFDKVDGRELSWLALAALLAFCTQQVRTIGIALTASLLVILLLSRRFKAFGIVFALFAVGILFQAWINLRNGGTVFSSGYEAQVLSGSLIEKMNQVRANASGYLDEVLAGSLIPVFGTRLEAAFGFVFFILNLIIFMLIVTGLLGCKPKLEWMHIYFVVYAAGILAFWNPQVGSVKARFLIPILPFLYFYFLNGLKWLTKGNLRAALGIAAIIALVLIARNLKDWRTPVRETMTDLSVGTNWIAENAPPDAIVMVNEPVPAYVHVKRRTINFPKNDQALEKYLDNQGVDYIVIAPRLQSPRSAELTNEAAETLALLLSSPEKFRIVFEDAQNNVRVFEYLGGGE